MCSFISLSVYSCCVACVIPQHRNFGFYVEHSIPEYLFKQLHKCAWSPMFLLTSGPFSPQNCKSFFTWQFFNKRTRVCCSQRWAKPSFISSAHLMSLSSTCGSPVSLCCFRGAVPQCSTLFHRSSQCLLRKYSMPLSSYFISRHFRKKSRCRLGSETQPDACKECRAIIYGGCVLDTWSWAHASSEREPLGLWAPANLHKSWYRYGIGAALATAHLTWSVPGFLLLNEPREFIFLSDWCIIVRLRFSWLKP